MGNFEHGQELLDYLTGQMGCPSVKWDENQAAGLDADGMSFLFYLADTAGVLVTTIYMGQPDLDDAALLQEILESNHFGEKTGGGSLSLDEETGHLCLCHQLRLPLEEPAQLEVAWAPLIGAARYWKKKLEQAAHGNPSPAGGMVSV